MSLNPLEAMPPLDVLSYADQNHWEALKAMKAQAVRGLRAGVVPTEWERSFLADLLESLSDYAAVIRHDLIAESLRRRQEA